MTCHVGGVAGPEELLAGRLVDEHAQPVERAAASRPGRLEQGRVEGVVHEVGDECTVGINSGSRASRSEPMPTLVALTTMSAPRTSSGVPTLPTAAAERRGVLRGGRRAIDHHDLGRPAATERVDHRTGCSPGPEHGDARNPPDRRRRRHGTSRRTAARRCCGRRADPRRPRDRVDRLQRLGLGGDEVDRWRRRRTCAAS